MARGGRRRWSKKDEAEMDAAVAMHVEKMSIDFPEPWTEQYLRAYKAVVVPVAGIPERCPNHRCYDRDWDHKFGCDDIPF